MRPLPLILVAQAIYSSARITHSLPEDPFAFPKYRVTFLNGLPVSNQTAERWLQRGLHGGELEFLDQPWHDDSGSQPWKEIGSGEESDSESMAPLLPSGYALERMKMGPHISYLCLIPPPTEGSSASSDEPLPDVTPVHSWSLLQPLAGTCIYTRDASLVYRSIGRAGSLTHTATTRHVRQFREMLRAHPSNPGRYEIEEDPEWEAFDLGRAPTTDTGAALTVADQNALTANLELARGPGARYLVQRWGDGTVCDKTGRRREIEVQFHCSMTMTDTIMFVKETKTCHYVLVIYTPRLCGVPGFKSRVDQREEALIRCREVVNADAPTSTNKALPEADHPLKQLLPASQTPDVHLPKFKVVEPEEQAQSSKIGDTIRRTIERLLQPKNPGVGGVVVKELDDGEVKIELRYEADDPESVPDQQKIAEALRSVGYRLGGEKETKTTTPTATNNAPPKDRQPAAAGLRRDEL